MTSFWEEGQIEVRKIGQERWQRRMVRMRRGREGEMGEQACSQRLEGKEEAAGQLECSPYNTSMK